MIKPLVIALMLFGGALAMAQTSALRLRATIEAVAPGAITVRERSGQVVTLELAGNLAVSEVYPIDIADIKAGSYIGTAAIPRADGTLEALEVLVFPEAARGAGEGHRPYDLMPQSTMTNAAVDGITTSSSGRTLQLKYKDGEKTLFVPTNVPVVSVKPGDNALLVVGAKLIVSGEMRDGKATATRITAGRNGFAPPM